MVGVKFGTRLISHYAILYRVCRRYVLVRVCALGFHFGDDLGFELFVFFGRVGFVEDVEALVLEENAKHAMFALKTLFAIFEVGAFPTIVAEV